MGWVRLGFKVEVEVEGQATGQGLRSGPKLCVYMYFAWKQPGWCTGVEADADERKRVPWQFGSVEFKTK